MQDELERWNGRYAAARERPEDLDAFVRELDEFTRAPDAPLELKRILSQAAQENLGLSADSPADVEAFERRAELALRAARAARERRTELWVEGVVARARLERGDARGALGALTPTPDDAANAGPELVEVWIATAEAQQRLGDLGSSVAAWERAAELSGRALGVAVATEDAASSVPSALPSDLREYYVSARLAALEALYLAWTARGVPDRAARALAEYDAMDAFVAREGPERATFGFQRLQLALAYRLTVEDPEGALAVLDELRALRDAPPEAELLQRFGRALVTARRLAPGVGVPEGLPEELDALAADERLAPDQRGQLRLAAVKLALRVGAFAHAELERRELETLVGAGALASSAWGTSPADLAALAVQIALARRAEPSELGAAIDRLRTTQSAAIEAELALPAPAGGTGRLYWPAARERLATCIEAELALGATVPSRPRSAPSRRRSAPTASCSPTNASARSCATRASARSRSRTCAGSCSGTARCSSPGSPRPNVRTSSSSGRSTCSTRRSRRAGCSSRARARSAARRARRAATDATRRAGPSWTRRPAASPSSRCPPLS